MKSFDRNSRKPSGKVFGTKIFSTTVLAMIAATGFFLPENAEAGYKIRSGSLINEKYFADKTVEEHYALLQKAVEEKKWEDVESQARIIVTSFPETSFSQESLYQLSIALYNQKEFDQANLQLNTYLKNKMQAHLVHFDEALYYKYLIAEQYRSGAKRRWFNVSALPKWAKAYDDAMEIYTEIINTAPGSEVAIDAMYGKGMVQMYVGSYTDAIKTFEQLIQLYPNKQRAIDAFVGISDTYVHAQKKEPNHPDYLQLARLNAVHFQKTYPNSDQYVAVQANIGKIEEIIAHSMVEIGHFYERKKLPGAADLYYHQTTERFPQTPAAAEAEKILEKEASVEPKKLPAKSAPSSKPE